MADQLLKDKNGRLIGKIAMSGSRYQGFDQSGRLKGSYDPKSDSTFDANGRLVGKGNLLSALVTQL